jgi:hypothetical protein
MHFTALLGLTVYLLWRCLSCLKEGVELLRQIRDRSRDTLRGDHSGSPSRALSLPGGHGSSRTVGSTPRKPAPVPSLPAKLPMAPPVAPVEHFLRDSAQLFAECLFDEQDVDTNKFIRACRHFGTVLERAGPFTMLSIRETHSNIVRSRSKELRIERTLVRSSAVPLPLGHRREPCVIRPSVSPCPPLIPCHVPPLSGEDGADLPPRP